MRSRIREKPSRRSCVPMVVRLYRRVLELLQQAGLANPEMENEDEAFIQAATEFGLIRTFPGFDNPAYPKTQGFEHRVYFDPDHKRVFKATKKGFGNCAGPLAYLRRIFLSNRVWGDSIKLEGIELKNGQYLRLFVSQNQVIGEEASQEIIDKLISDLGFQKTGHFMGERKVRGVALMISDLSPDNVFVDEEGRPVVIDGLIDLMPKERFLEFAAWA